MRCDRCRSELTASRMATHRASPTCAGRRNLLQMAQRGFVPQWRKAWDRVLIEADIGPVPVGAYSGSKRCVMYVPKKAATWVDWFAAHGVRPNCSALPAFFHLVYVDKRVRREVEAILNLGGSLRADTIARFVKERTP